MGMILPPTFSMPSMVAGMPGVLESFAMGNSSSTSSARKAQRYSLTLKTMTVIDALANNFGGKGARWGTRQRILNNDYYHYKRFGLFHDVKFRSRNPLRRQNFGGRFVDAVT